MNNVLDDLKKKLGEEFLEKKENRVKKPRQQRSGLTSAQQRAQDARAAAEEKRKLKVEVKQELKLGVRTVPLNKIIKDVLDYLAQEGRPVSREDLEARFSFRVQEDAELARHLHKNPKIKHREGVYEYVYQFRAKDRGELLQRVRENPMGVQRRDVRENYATVDQDLAALREEGLIYIIQEKGKELDEDLILPRDRMGLAIDAEVLAMWKATEVPRDADGLQKELTKHGLKAATRTSQRKIEPAEQDMGKKKKRPRRGGAVPIPSSAANLHDDAT